MKKDHPKASKARPEKNPAFDKQACQIISPNYLDKISELEARLNRLQALVESVDDVLVEIDTSGRVLYVSPNVEKYLGYKPEDVIGKIPTVFMPPEEVAEKYSHFIELASQGKKLEAIEMTYIHKEGHHYIMEACAVPYFGNEGQLLGYRGVVRDITERKKSELQLQESRQRLEEVAEKYSTIIKTTSDGVWINNLEGEILEVNDAYCRISGYSRDELIHMSVSELEAVETPREIADHIRKMVEMGGHDRFETCHRRKDGSIVDVEISSLFFKKNGGRIAILIRDITDRKRAEKALRKKEADLQLIANATPVLLTRLSRDLRYVFVNRACAEMLGRPAEEIIGRPIVDILGKEAFQTIRPYVERVLQGERVEYDAEIPYQGPGSRFVHVEYIPEMDQQGEVVGWLATILDISERKRAEEALRANEERYRMLVDSSPDAIIVHRRGRNIYANAAALKLYGVETLEQLQTKTIFDVIHPKYHSSVVQRTKRVESGLPIEHLELEIVSFDGRTVPVEAVASMMINYEGEPAFQVTVRDITGRKKAEEALQKAKEELEIKVLERTHELAKAMNELKKSEEAYRLLVELNPIGVFRYIYNPVTGENKRLHCNESHLRILGYSSREEYLNGIPAEVLSEGDWNTFIKSFLTDGKVINYPAQMKRKDGSRIWVLLNANARSHNGVFLVEGAMTDITAQKKTEERLRKAQKNLRAMASEIVMADERSRQHFATDLHDTVVQTMGAAKLRSQLIQDNIPKDIIPIFSEMQDLVSQSITQARLIMAEMSPPVLYELGFVPALEWLTEQIESQHDISVEFKAKDIPPLIHEIQILLFQATRELLMNVVKHAKSKTAVVKASANGLVVKIEIRDQGIGFESRKGFRTDVSGGGFGLFSIRERLKHFGGELHIRTKPGQGTRVTMTVPRLINGNS